MSHFAACHTVINDADMLIHTLRQCGLRVERGIAIRGYQKSLSSITYSIVGCHDELEQDLGYTEASDGTFTVHFHAQSDVAAIMQKVAQTYAANNAAQASQTMQGLKNAKVNVLAHN